MDPTSTQSLIESARTESGAEALRLVGEALRVSPEDHHARAEVGLLLGALGRTDAAATALCLAAQLLLRRGYVLSAVARAKDALRLAPKSPLPRSLLEDLHRRIVGRPISQKTLALAPMLPKPLTEGDPLSLLSEQNEKTLIERVEALALRDPDASPTQIETGGVPLLSDLSTPGFMALVESFELCRLPPDAVVLKQGEPGSSLFLLASGDVEVLRESEAGPKVLARLGGGALFGEMALIIEQPRSASVIAKTAVELFEIKREHVEAAARQHAALTQELVDFARRRLLRNLVETSPLFQAFDGRQRLELLRAFASRVVPSGTVIIQRGAPSAGLFVIATGEVRVTTTDQDGDEVELARLGDGDVLGEISLLEAGMTTASATASRKTVLLHLPRERFEAMVKANPTATAYLGTLSRDRLSANQRAVAAGAESVEADDLIVI